MFEWDKRKAERNQSKHSISFPYATRAFDDENRVTVISVTSYQLSVTTVRLAKIDQFVYVVAFTFRSSNIRLISARKANKKEVKCHKNR